MVSEAECNRYKGGLTPQVVEIGLSHPLHPSWEIRKGRERGLEGWKGKGIEGQGDGEGDSRGRADICDIMVGRRRGRFILPLPWGDDIRQRILRPGTHFPVTEFVSLSWVESPAVTRSVEIGNGDVNNMRS